MRRLIVIVLSTLILSPSFGGLFIYTSFKINQKEIAKTLCVQRKVAFNECNGKCQLQKRIKKYSDSEKNKQDNLQDRLELVYIQNATEVNFDNIPIIESKENTSTLFKKKPVKASNFTFHPPV